MMNSTPAVQSAAASGQPRINEMMFSEQHHTSAPARVALPPRRKMFAVTVEDFAQLDRYADDWDALAESAIEPNPFYERWMLEPALAPFGKDKRLIFVFIFASDIIEPAARPVLCGFFPLDLSNKYDGLGKPLPLKTVGLWKHKYCYLCTPLVRDEGAAETIAAFFA